MKKISNIILKSLIKYFPMLANVYVIISIILDHNKISISNYTFDIFGGSIYLGLVCFFGSYIYGYGAWHKVLSASMIIAYFLEWADLNWFKIPNIIFILQGLFIFSSLMAIILFSYSLKVKISNKIRSKRYGK